MAARTDNVNDPSLIAGLLLARRGQSFFSRKVNELTDEEFDGPSLLDGWDRRHLVAHVGLNARALTRLTSWASTGTETPMYGSSEQRSEEIELAATLPIQALRNLSDHAAIHLNVEWRDLEEEAWSREVKTAQGRIVPVSETVWMRTREVWIHAVDLNNGAHFSDLPLELLDAILIDVISAWQRRREAENIPNIVLEATDVNKLYSVGENERDRILLRGSTSALAAWATGRGSSGVVSGDDLVAPPRWL